MYHVAPWLSTEQYRRLIGNDVLMIIFYENAENIPFEVKHCKKMGKVPQVCLEIYSFSQALDIYRCIAGCG